MAGDQIESGEAARAVRVGSAEKRLSALFPLSAVFVNDFLLTGEQAE